MSAPTRPLALTFATIAVLGMVLGSLAAAAAAGPVAVVPSITAAGLPQGGPAPNGPTTCPGTTPYTSAQIVIEADGGVYPTGAPVTVTGSLYQLTEPLDSSVLDLASNATVDLSNCLLTYATVGGYGNNTAVDVAGASNVTVEYLSSTAPGDEAVTVQGSSAVTVYGSNATHALDYGISVDGAQDVNVTGNNVSYAEDGVFVHDTIDAVVLDNQMVGVTDAALYAVVTSGVLFLHNDGRFAAFYGAYVEEDTDTVLSGNDLSGNLNDSGSGIGIYAEFSDADRFAGNDLSGANEYGVYVDEPDGSVVVAHNNLTGGLEYGIYVQDGYYGSGVTVLDNDVQNVTMYGLDAYEPGTLNITGNSFALASPEPEATGIYIDGALGTLSVTDNRLSGGYATGLLLFSDGGLFSIARNIIANTTYEAIDLVSCAATSIVANDLEVNATGANAGIYLDNSYGLLSIVDNQITGGYDEPIDLTDVNANLIVRGNNATGALDASLYILETESTATISDNALGANASTVGLADGIYVENYLSGPTLISGNYLGGGLYDGLWIDFVYANLNVSGNTITNTTGAGAYLDEEALGDVGFWDNNFSVNTTVNNIDGIDWEDDAGNVTIVDNVFDGGLYYGVYTDDVLGTTLLADNVFGNVTTTGADLGESEGGVVAVDNEFFGNGSATSSNVVGLYVTESSGATSYVAHNTATGGLGGGVFDVDSETSQTLIYDNTVQDSVDFGIFVDGAYAPVAVVGNTVTGAQGYGIFGYEDDNLTIADNQVPNDLIAINVTDDDAGVLVEGNNASGSYAALEVDMYFAESLAILEDNNLGDSNAVEVNNSIVDFVANNLLGTPTVWLTNDTFSEFYHNNIETDGPAFLDLFDSSPITGVYNAPLPIGGNFWTGYTPTSCSYVCSPPYAVPSQSGSSGYLDEYPLGTAWTAYSISFEETGLPSGTAWSVTFNGSVLTATAPASIVVYPSNVAPVTYPYAIPGVGSYSQVSPSSGSVTASGTSQTISVTFAEPSYPVTFSEKGLGVGLTWYVNATGTPSFPAGAFAVTSAGSQAFALGNLTNGTYAYSVAVDRGGFLPTTSATGTFTVNGGALTVSYVYTTVNYTVTFQQTGLPSGGSWSVTVNGVPLSSTGGVLSIALPNGTYSFSVTVPTGYTATPATHGLSVAGGPVASYIAIAPVPSSSSSSTNNDLVYGLLAGLVIAAALAVLAFALLARKGRSGGSAPPPAWAPPPAGATASAPAAAPAAGDQPWSEGGPSPPSPPPSG